jgi:elongation factor G
VKEYTTDQIRNVGVAAHAYAGKTTLAEAMLFSAGEIPRMGKVDDGSTVSDYHPDEIERKNSILASVLHCQWKEHKINLIDMPGFADFIGEVKAGLRVADTALLVLNAGTGVEVGTETAWRFAEEYGAARMFFVNRLDKENTNFDKLMESLHAQFHENCVAVQFPVNPGESFSQIVDIVQMKLMTFETNGSGKYTVSDIPANLQNRAKAMRDKLVDTAAASDDKLTEKYLEAGELSAEEVLSGLRSGIAAGTVFPVLCGAALKNVGVYPLLNFLVELAPSPAARPKISAKSRQAGTEVKIDANANGHPAALVFKTISEAHLGELSFFRVYSGTMTHNTEAINASRQAAEKIGQIFVMNGKTRKEITRLVAGDIGAAVKLKHTHTGDTLGDKREPVMLPGIEFPEPLMSIAVEPKSKGDEDKLSTGLHALHEEDPSFKVRVDPELRQILLMGQSELHLGIIVKRLKEKYNVDVTVVEAKIPYRETIRSMARELYRHKKQTGGAGQFGEVHFHIEPYREGAPYPSDFTIRGGDRIDLTELSWGGKLEFINAIVGGVVDARFVPAIKKGVMEIMETGVVAGYPVTDVRVIFHDGKMHPVDSNENAFRTAGRMCFRESFLKAKPVLLEPIFEVEITVPGDYMGDVMGDLSGHRGKILGVEGKGANQVVRAMVPLKEMAKYSTKLRSMTQGRGVYKQKFAQYEELPRDQAEKLMAEFEKARAQGSHGG